MLVSELVKRIRFILNDEDKGYEDDLLWSNTELIHYVSRAQKEACLRARLISDDSTTAVTQISLVADTATYSLHSSVIRIDSMVLASTNKEIDKIDQDHMDEFHPQWRNDSGIVSHYMEYWNQRKIRFWRTPDAVDTVNMQVKRLPIIDPTAMTVALEINDEYAEKLDDGVISLAYRKNGSQTHNLDLSEYHDRKFAQSFGPPVSIKGEIVNREFNRSKKRTRICW